MCFGGEPFAEVKIGNCGVGEGWEEEQFSADAYLIRVEDGVSVYVFVLKEGVASVGMERIDDNGGDECREGCNDPTLGSHVGEDFRNACVMCT